LGGIVKDVVTLRITMMKASRKQLILILIATLAALFGTSCRTVQGLGQDVEHAGEHIEDAAH
jgi:predicted small secreted protein